MKILANDGIAQSGIDVLEAAGFTVVTKTVEQDNLVAAINENRYVGLLVRSATKVRQPLIDACPTLRLIGRGGVGMDNIDVEYARAKGLAVINTPSASSQSVAELVMAHLFGCVRFLYDSNRNMPTRGAADFKTLKKAYAKGIELRGKTLGIVGFGRIGQSVASYALGIGMKVIASDRYVDSVDIPVRIEGLSEISAPVKTIPMENLFAQADFISLHIPAQADGQAVIGAKEFASMKDGVILVNAARGGVVDEPALLDAINSGKVAHAALDVFENEPTPSAAVVEHQKVSLSPHIGAATLEAQDRIGTELADKIIAFFEPKMA